MSEESKEGFLKRWSRVKTEARAAAPTAAAADAPAPAKPAADEPVPELPSIDKLTLESDFSGFFHPKVDEDLRRTALRKLFSDPHFNVMDGLDVYIDDYSKTEPIPAAMLASLRQAQRILDWAADKGEQSAPPADSKVDAEARDQAQTEPVPPAFEDSHVQSAVDTKSGPDIRPRGET
jgi:hypothetical protein